MISHTGVMLALAIVLLVIVLLLVIVSFVGNSEEVVIDFLNVTITTSVGGVFVGGVLCGLLALASLLAIRRSWRQHQARAEEVRELRRLAGVPDEGDANSTPGTATEERSPSSSADVSRTNLTAPSDGGQDTAPLPSPEDPPRT